MSLRVSPPPAAVHEDYRIALYYLYADIQDPAAHVCFQQDLGSRLGLTGRIRVASEGINGVLSGRRQDLEEYEQAFLQEVTTTTGLPNLQKSDLDVKFCQLRPDLPVQAQLFSNLLVKETKTVIGLVDLSQDERPKSRKYKKKQGAPPNVEHQEKLASDASTLSVRDVYQRALNHMRRDSSVGGDGENAANAIGEPRHSISIPHLSPDEWDSRISELASQPENAVVLLDCRNVYESNVGHFCAPQAQTMLTNTRKFSELPHVMVEQSDLLSQSTHIFAYCTGGVRCERGTVFLQELLREKYPNRSLPSIYQLHGGIQRYLEIDAQKSSSADQPPRESLYRGKNFVFDPRRVDPMNRDSPVVGRCLVCRQPHDDYDNGQAPSLDRASRCWNCRVLILVCNDCRTSVSCWGDAPATGDDNDSLPKMYCGGVGKPCWHRPPVQVVAHAEVL